MLIKESCSRMYMDMYLILTLRVSVRVAVQDGRPGMKLVTHPVLHVLHPHTSSSSLLEYKCINEGMVLCDMCPVFQSYLYAGCILRYIDS
jgi:hypothetical protein